MYKNAIELIAPCGIDCSHCSAYLNGQYEPHGRYKSKCAGCRPRNKQCAFLKKHCPLLPDNKVDFCFECPDFPCERLTHLEERYKIRGFPTSFIANNKRLKEVGPEKLRKELDKRFACPDCGGPTSIHDRICYVCGKHIPNKENL